MYNIDIRNITPLTDFRNNEIDSADGCYQSARC